MCATTVSDKGRNKAIGLAPTKQNSPLSSHRQGPRRHTFEFSPRSSVTHPWGYLHLCPFLEGSFDIHVDDRDVSFPVRLSSITGGAGGGETEDVCVGRGFVWEGGQGLTSRG